MTASLRLIFSNNSLKLASKVCFSRRTVSKRCWTSSNLAANASRSCSRVWIREPKIESCFLASPAWVSSILAIEARKVSNSLVLASYWAVSSAFSLAILCSFKFSDFKDSISSTCFIHTLEISCSWVSKLLTFCWYCCLTEIMRPSKSNDLKRSSAAVNCSRKERISLACSADFLSASIFSCWTFLISRSNALLTAFNWDAFWCKLLIRRSFSSRSRRSFSCVWGASCGIWAGTKAGALSSKPRFTSGAWSKPSTRAVCARESVSTLAFKLLMVSASPATKASLSFCFSMAWRVKASSLKILSFWAAEASKRSSSSCILASSFSKDLSYWAWRETAFNCFLPS